MRKIIKAVIAASAILICSSMSRAHDKICESIPVCEQVLDECRDVPLEQEGRPGETVKVCELVTRCEPMIVCQ
jgi:hypothetical protein